MRNIVIRDPEVLTPRQLSNRAAIWILVAAADLAIIVSAWRTDGRPLVTAGGGIVASAVFLWLAIRDIRVSMRKTLELRKHSADADPE